MPGLLTIARVNVGWQERARRLPRCFTPLTYGSALVTETAHELSFVSPDDETALLEGRGESDRLGYQRPRQTFRPVPRKG